MGVWVSTPANAIMIVPYLRTLRRSTEIPKAEPIGSTLTQRRVYGKSQMVRPRRVMLVLFR
jgi:hypothetical protein